MYAHRKYNYYKKNIKLVMYFCKFILYRYRIKYIFDISSNDIIVKRFYVGNIFHIYNKF